MIGAYDFCGHYEWTFAWLERQGGEKLVREYWDEAIHQDAQRHAVKLIAEKGFAGMREYWGHTLAEEEAGYAVSETDDVFRVDMHECPSKGFLLRNGLHQYSDYCDHCMGWIGPLLKDAAYTVDHQHNHKGKCWWELRRNDSDEEPSMPGQLAGESDVRLGPDWDAGDPSMDTYRRANHPDDKEIGSEKTPRP